MVKVTVLRDQSRKLVMVVEGTVEGKHVYARCALPENKGDWVKTIRDTLETAGVDMNASEARITRKRQLMSQLKSPAGAPAPAPKQEAR